ncbi:MAG: alpha-amylase family glycosyl hydrolase [Acidobacteriota bacterium]
MPDAALSNALVVRHSPRACLTACALALALLCGCASSPGASPPASAPPAETASAGDAPSWDLDWARDAVAYEIFVRSFADSDGDGIGDLRGLTARLDELNDGDPDTDHDLGVDLLWLMPIFDSPSYHGYDVVDYDAIEPDYGTEADLRALIEAAHARGIRVLVDFVLNHSSAQHPWFLDAATGPDAAHRDWYVWRRDDPGWTQPWSASPTWHPLDAQSAVVRHLAQSGGAPASARDDRYYGVFWSGMPDLNHENPDVRATLLASALRWLDLGLDGFRLDATRYLIETSGGAGQADTPETHAALRAFADAVRAKHPDALLVAENWTSASIIATYYDDVPMSFNFPLADAMVRSVQRGDARPVADALATMARLYPSGALDGTFLRNHDQTRLASILAGDPRPLRAAASLLLTLPGTPFLYYGEEIGMRNGPSDHDRDKRLPMAWTPDDRPAGDWPRSLQPFSTAAPWAAPTAERSDGVNVADQRDDPASLLSIYRSLIRLRRDVPALRRGDLQMLAPRDAKASDVASASEAAPLLVFVRVAADGERALVAHNLSADEAAVRVPLTGSTGPTLRWSHGAHRLSRDADGAATLVLGGGASAVWTLD